MTEENKESCPTDSSGKCWFKCILAIVYINRNRWCIWLGNMGLLLQRQCGTLLLMYGVLWKPKNGN